MAIQEQEHINISYTALPTAREFHASNAFVRGVTGCIGSGKSVMCVWEMFERCRGQIVNRGVRRSRWAIVRSTYPELKLTTLNTFLDWIPELSVPGYSLQLNRQPPMNARLNMKLEDGTRVEAEFIFIALDTADDVKKLKSLELTGIWLNEATEIQFEIFKMARGRVRRFPSVRNGGYNWSGVIMDTNPCEEGADSWWYKLAEIEKPVNYAFWKQPPALLRIPKKNPRDPHEPQMYCPNTGQGAFPPAENVCNHTAGFSYWMDLCAGSGEDWIKVFILGEYGSVIDGKPVYSEYFDALHMARDDKGNVCDLNVMRGLPLIVAIDFGLTPCAVFAQQTPRGELRIIDEMISDDMGIRQFARDMLKPHLANIYYNMPRVMIGDPAGSQRAQASDEVSCMQELANAGLPTEMAKTNLFRPRREAVAGFLTKLVNGKPGLQISKKCVTVREAFKGKYQYRKMRTTAGNAYSAEPLKNHPWSDVSDCIAKGSLITMSDGLLKPIECIKEGDIVATQRGSSIVSRAWLVKEAAPVIELVSSGGNSLFATKDHRIKAGNQWKSLDSLQYGDILHCISNEKEMVQCRKTKIMSSRVKDTTEIDRDITITRCRDERMVPDLKNHYIKQFGFRIIAIFQVGFAFIIKILTKKIMIYQISNYYRQTHTHCSIIKNVIKKIRFLTWKHLRLQEKRLVYGIGQKKVVNGIVNILKKYGRIVKNMFLYVCSAVKNIMPINKVLKGDSVLRHVKVMREDTAESTMKQEYVPYVKKNILLTNTTKARHVQKVVQINYSLLRKDVYDLTVKDDHSFFANGILVHNCAQYIALHAESGAISGKDINGSSNMQARTVKAHSSLGWD